MNLIYGSVCSGIEAASVAWHPLGWRAAWLAEIEPFPARVLHHHYGSGQPVHMPDPDADGIDNETVTARRANLKAVSALPTIISPSAPRNLGDMTKIAAMVRSGAVAAPDVLVGGTPCQAFSIAGLRASLGDARGQLSLSFVDLANAIDTARYVRGEPAAVVLWENVPGVLSTADNAFGCFLGALAGEDFPLEPAGGKWSNAGCVYGPQRTVAWRVLDAQYFGVAQRRRRVFVIASARKGFDPTEVLFEFDGVRRDFAPSREAGEDVATAPAGSVDGGRDAGADQDSGVICMAHGQGGAEIARERRATLTCNHEAPIAAYSVALRGRDGGATAELGGEVAGRLRTSGGGGDKAHVLAPTLGRTLLKGGHSNNPLDETLIATRSAPIAFDSRQDCVSSEHVFGALGSSSPQAQAQAVTYSIQAGALRTNPNSGPDGVGVQEHIAYTLEARAEVQAVAFVQNSRDEVRLMGGDGQIVGALAAQPGMKQTCYVAQCVTGDITHTLKAEGFDASEDGIGRGQPIVAAFDTYNQKVTGDVTQTLCFRGDSPGGNAHLIPAVQHGMAVRRITPRECERLQAFPDFHTLIPMSIVKPARAETMQVNGDPVALIDGQWWKMSADGPRYKALGNSMCTENMAWLGRRIEMALAGLAS